MVRTDYIKVLSADIYMYIYTKEILVSHALQSVCITRVCHVSVKLSTDSVSVHVSPPMSVESFM